MRPGQGAQVPRAGPDRPRQPLRRGRLLHRLLEGGREADPGLRALRGPGQPLRALEPGRRLRGRQPLHGAGPHRGGLRQPHEARLQGLPRGLLLQAPGGPRAARPARRRAPGALRLPQLRGEPHALGGRRGQGPADRGLVPGGVRQGLLLHGGAVARSRAAGRGDRGHDPDRPGHRGAALRDQRLALPGGRALARPRGAALHPDRHHDERPEPLEVLQQRVLREVGRRDAGRLQGSARGLPQHPRGGRALQRGSAVRPVPPAELPGARRLHARLLPRAPRLRGARPPLRKLARATPSGSACATSWAWSPRWASPATSWWCGTSSPTPGARASRWDRGAAPRPARWSPTVSASPTWTRSATGSSSSDS